VQTRIVVADDSALIREGIAGLLAPRPDLIVVRACSDLGELRRAIASEAPDVVITDIRMPPTLTDEGIQIARELAVSHPAVGVVVLSQYSGSAYVLRLLESGSAGRAYLLKENVHRGSELESAVREVANGGSVIDPRVVDELVNSRLRGAGAPLADLTAREREVLALIAQGRSNVAIAEALVITRRAVEKHINTIYLKLGVKDDGNISKRVTATLTFLARSG
jgi:DNA-binding NarL/FixJ family response regulator